MINSNLIEMLRKLNAKEFKDLGDFVSSAFFNKNQSIIKLYTYVKKYYPEFNSGDLVKEKIYKNIFSGAEYNDGFMRTVIFYFTNLVEEYLAYISFKKNPVSNSLYLIEEFNSRKLEKPFLKKLTFVKNNLDNAKIEDTQYYYYKYRFESIMAEYYNWRRYKIKDYKDYEDKSVLNLIEYITSCFLSGTLTYYKFLEHKSHYEKVNFELKFLDSVIEYLKRNDDYFKNIPKIRIELFQLLLLKEEKLEYYEILKKIYLSDSEDINPYDKYSLGTVLQHFCIRMQYKGESKYMRERFELYKTMIENKYYINSSDIYFDDILFGSIVLVATTLQEYEWTEKFINEHKELLAPQNKNNILNYCMARVCIGKGEFEKALKSLMFIKSIKQIQFKIVVRNLILITYYELSLFTQAFSMLDSHRHFVNNSLKYLPEERISMHVNFFKLYSKFLKVKEKANINDVYLLRKELNETTNLSEQSWFQKKLEELEKLCK